MVFYQLLDRIGQQVAFQRRGILRRCYIRDLRRQRLTDHAAHFVTVIWGNAMLDCWLDAGKP